MSKKYTGEEFWDNLWEQIIKNSRGLSSEVVLNTLREISDELYDAGIDSVYDKSIRENPTLDPIHFDITWMTLFAVRLKEKRKK